VAPVGAFKLAIIAVAGVVVAATTLYTALWGPRARARKRLAAGTSTIEDHTIVTLTGKVRAIETLRAPLSGAECVAFVAYGKILGGQYENDIPFVTQEMVPFDLETKDGVVRVEVGALEIVLPALTLIPRKIDLEAKFLVAHGFDASLIRGSGFQQTVVTHGDRICVQGLALVEQAPPSDATGYRETTRVIRLVAHEGHPLTIGPPR
jgi:hypothetical protein